MDRFAFDIELLHLVERHELSLVEVPVRHLLEPRNVEVAQPREVIERMWPNETFVFRGHRIFGATARTLRHVLNIALPALVAGT